MRIFLSARVHDVVGTDDHGHIRFREILIDLIHFKHDVIGYTRLRQENVHVTWHAACHGMDGESNGHSTLPQEAGDFLNRMLGLRDGHAVAWDQHHVSGCTQQFRSFSCTDGHHFACGCRTRGRSASPASTESPGDDRKEVPVHGLAHDVGKDGA